MKPLKMSPIFSESDHSITMHHHFENYKINKVLYGGELNGQGFPARHTKPYKTECSTLVSNSDSWSTY